MKNLSYTKSHSLTEKIKRIDELRKDILLVLLPPSVELQLQWSATLERYRLNLLNKGAVLTERLIEDLFNVNKRDKSIPHLKSIQLYKKTQEYLRQNWIINPVPVKTEDIQTIMKLNSYSSPIETKTLSRYLHYIQVNPEHPLIQAALIHIMFLSLVPVKEETKTIASHLSLLFLYKYGYDLNKLLVLERYLNTNSKMYNDLIVKSSRSENATEWIEYFIDGYYTQLLEIQKKVTLKDQPRTSSSFTHLSQRQKDILQIMERPGMRMTNKLVQKQFEISQITASRDLSRLADLGLLFSNGKGRSVYYTKV